MTDLSSTNWRALCAELHAVFNTYAVCEEHHRLLVRTAAALGQSELQQEPPKNCWLDDEPDFCPSPCVFDDPSEVISNCVYAQQVKCKTDCGYYRNALAQPEPQEPSLKEQALTALHAIATGANDTREQHQDLDTIRQALEQLDD